MASSETSSTQAKTKVQTKVTSTPNRAGTARPQATWKWKHMLKKMIIPGYRLAKEGYDDTEDTDTDSVKSYLASILVKLILICYYRRNPLLAALLGRLKRRKRSEKLYIKVTEYCIFQEIKGVAKKSHLLSTESFAQSGPNWFIY